MCRIVFPNLVFIVLMSVRLINSQAFDARIEGTVTDSTGAAVAGARISAVNTENGSVLVGAADDSGLYRFPIATLGNYTLTVERAGFKKSVRSGVQLRSPQTVTIDVVLERTLFDDESRQQHIVIHNTLAQPHTSFTDIADRHI